jgi:SAM-dependent methyltransferase
MATDESDFNLETMAEAKRYNAFLADSITAAAGSSRRLLDFGAGSGTFADTLRSPGRQITCVEAEPRLLARLRDKGFEAHADLQNFPAGTVDFAYTLNVLEHIDDDVAALRDIGKALKPGGRLFIYVPAFMILFTSMDRKVHHLRRYRRNELIRRVRAGGFSVERAEYVDSIGFAATLLYRLIGSSSGDINVAHLKLYDRFVFPLSRMVDRITNRLFGKNVLLIATRSTAT